MADLQQLEDQIVGLSLLDAAALVKKLEERLGVSAAAAAPVVVAGGAGAGAAAAEPARSHSGGGRPWPGVLSCGLCRSPSHATAACPRNHWQCFRCHRFGHVAARCDRRGEPRYTCNLCGGQGHDPGRCTAAADDRRRYLIGRGWQSSWPNPLPAPLTFVYRSGAAAGDDGSQPW